MTKASLQGDFYAAYSLDQLAQMQKVKPVTSDRTVIGALPEETELDAFLEAIYSSRR